MNITVEIKAPELAAAIQALAGAMSGSGVNIGQPAPVKVETKPEKSKAEEKPRAEKPKTEEKEEEPVKAATATAEDKPAISLEVVRDKLAKLSQAGKQKEVKALISSFGVKKFSEIPADKYEELLAKAETL